MQPQAEELRVTGNLEDLLTSNTSSHVEKALATCPQLNLGEEELNLGEPLRPIDPEESPYPETEYDQDTIVVKSQEPSASQNQDLLARVPQIRANRGSQDVHQSREMFGLGAY